MSTTAAARLLHNPMTSSTTSNTRIPNFNFSYKFPNNRISFPQNHSLRILHGKVSPPRFELSSTGGGGGYGTGHGNGGGDGSGGFSGDGDNKTTDVGIWGLLLNGWRSRVAADPQFPFKVLMEQLVGVTACVIGDMASRPNFGVNELDFVFSTLVVGSIMNFTLMYLLAPTLFASPQNLPGLFANCPTSHMFEPGAYSFANRFGTFVFKGVVFASAGFAAGLVGTAISNGLIKLRKKMDPNFETPNEPPPTILNALTWAIHMGISSNLRYQTLNGIEFLLAKSTPEVVFKSSVVVLRCLNNVLGGMSFVILARMTGSQSVCSDNVLAAAEAGSAEEEKQKLVDDGDQNERSN